MYADVAKILGFEGPSEKVLRQKASTFLATLSEYGLYERLGAGEYVLKPEVMAYALGIERLRAQQAVGGGVRGGGLEGQGARRLKSVHRSGLVNVALAESPPLGWIPQLFPEKGCLARVPAAQVK